MIIELSSADDRIEMNENARKRMFFEYFSIKFHSDSYIPTVNTCIQCKLNPMHRVK